MKDALTILRKRMKTKNKKYNFSRKETLRRAFRIVDRILKRMREKCTIYVILPDTKEQRIKQNEGFRFVSEFDGYPRDPNRSKIELSICLVDDLKKGPEKLRRWNASVAISLIHELCHWQIFWAMNIKEATASAKFYHDEGIWNDIEEIATWTMTIDYLKQLRYHRSKVLREELRLFTFPESFQLAPPFGKKIIRK